MGNTLQIRCGVCWWCGNCSTERERERDLCARRVQRVIRLRRVFVFFTNETEDPKTPVVASCIFGTSFKVFKSVGCTLVCREVQIELHSMRLVPGLPIVVLSSFLILEGGLGFARRAVLDRCNSGCVHVASAREHISLSSQGTSPTAPSPPPLFWVSGNGFNSNNRTSSGTVLRYCVRNLNQPVPQAAPTVSCVPARFFVPLCRIRCGRVTDREYSLHTIFATMVESILVVLFELLLSPWRILLILLYYCCCPVECDLAIVALG